MDIDNITNIEGEITTTGIAEHTHNAIVAFSALIMIVRKYNEGWMPDWADPLQRKYYLIFDIGPGIDVPGKFQLKLHNVDYDTLKINTCNRLYFRSPILARECFARFWKLWNLAFLADYD